MQRIIGRAFLLRAKNPEHFFLLFGKLTYRIKNLCTRVDGRIGFEQLLWKFGLFDDFNASGDELVQRLAAQHAPLQQSQIYKLM